MRKKKVKQLRKVLDYYGYKTDSPEYKFLLRKLKKQYNA